MGDPLVWSIGQFEVGEPELGSLEFACAEEQTTLLSSGDIIGIQLQGQIAYIPRAGKPIHPSYPQVIELHGSLFYGSHSAGGLGAQLVSPGILAFPHSNEKRSIAFVFTCTRRQLQDMEDRRASEQEAHVSLGVIIKGVAAIVAPISASASGDAQELTQPNTAPYSMALGGTPKVTLDRIARVGSPSSGSFIQISRSHWTDMLKAIGYPQRRAIDLPPVDAEHTIPEIRLATQHLIAAHGAFVADQFRQAVQLCRQSRDALLPGESVEQRKTWAIEHFTPALGGEKALMIYQSVDALRMLGNAASHGGEKNMTIEIDRDVAEYAIGQLTLILHYLDRKLR